MVHVRVQIESLALQKPFIFMLDRSLEENIEAFVTSMGHYQSPQLFTYIVDGVDLE